MGEGAEGAGAQHYNGPSGTGPRLGEWGMQPATIDCIEEYRIMAIMARNAPSDCLVYAVCSQSDGPC